jgi:hypothetical protein
VIKNLAKHEFEEFAKLVEDDFINFLALRYIPLLLLHQDLTVGEIIDKVFHEYCRTVERNVILKVLGYLIKLGLVKVIA